MFSDISLRRVASALVAALAVIAGPALAFPGPTEGNLTGEVVIEAFPATGDARLIRETGQGEAVFLETAPGEITFTAKSEMAERGGISLSFRLKQGEDGIWREMTEDSQIAVSAGGRISGVTDTGTDLVTLSGIVGEDRLHLDIRHRPHPFGPEGEAPDLAELVEVHFRFDLRQPSKPAAENAAPAESGKGNDCRQIIWETRASPNIFAGGVDLIRVPVCIP